MNNIRHIRFFRIGLYNDEFAALLKISDEECRDFRDQAAYFIHLQLLQSELIVDYIPVIEAEIQLKDKEAK